MVFHYLGPPAYVFLLVAISIVLTVIWPFIFRDSIRIAGAGSWIAYILLAPVGGLLALPCADLMGGSSHAAVSLMAFGMIFSVPVFHVILPAVAPDFQCKAFGATLLLAAMVGLAAMIAGWSVGVVGVWLPGNLV